MKTGLFVALAAAAAAMTLASANERIDGTYFGKKGCGVEVRKTGLRARPDGQGSFVTFRMSFVANPDIEAPCLIERQSLLVECTEDLSVCASAVPTSVNERRVKPHYWSESNGRLHVEVADDQVTACDEVEIASSGRSVRLSCTVDSNTGPNASYALVLGKLKRLEE